MKTLLGLTGSVASSLAVKITAKFALLGPVNVVPTESSKHFFNQCDIIDVGGRIWTDSDEWQHWAATDSEVVHIDLRRWANVLVVAPLSANTLAKIAQGISDNLLTCILRAWDMSRPIILAPAMNTHMWNHPLTARHINLVKEIYPNVNFIMPVIKTLACGDNGMGAMAPIEDIVDAAKESLRWNFPIDETPGIPVGNHPGAFGFKRKYDIHSGVDLYCKEGSPVYAVEDGTVVLIESFTGPSVGTPWWNDTKCLLVEGATGCVNYGEVHPIVKIGNFVKRGEVIAHVIPVLREGKERPDIPGHSRNMLHIELYSHGTRTTSCWIDQQPISLMNPTQYLLDSKFRPNEIVL